MPRYYFSLKNGRPFRDVDGLELPDIDAVRTEAVGFARDVMRMEPERQDWSQWAVCVTDDAQKSVITVAFCEVT
jgi:uncharacterized protein DUF6894